MLTALHLLGFLSAFPSPFHHFINQYWNQISEEKKSNPYDQHKPKLLARSQLREEENQQNNQVEDQKKKVAQHQQVSVNFGFERIAEQ